jgi:alkylated DNA repair dioxygenase AlkB
MSQQKASYYFSRLKESINWQQEQIKMFGKTYNVPRKTAWYGEDGFDYTYSGIKCNPEKWTKELLEIKKVIEHFLPDNSFNSVLLNLYRNGEDKVSWHSDDEPELGANPVIASVSLGSTRRFDLKHKDDPAEKLQIDLSPGSLIVMCGGLQHSWLHQIPIQRRIKDPRINLTFRNIIMK